MTSRRARSGFTLIEMLVVIAIIGVLVGLLLPAISAARESARRSKCLSNQRNLALGILGYVNDFGVFPPSGDVRRGRPHAREPDGQPARVRPFTIGDRRPVLAGRDGSVLDGGSRTGIPMYSYIVPVLPYIDNQELFNQWQMYLPAVPA